MRVRERRRAVGLRRGGRFGLMLAAAVWLWQPALAQTGLESQASHPFDREVMTLLARFDLPGGAIAVARHGRLVVSRGYGLANRATNRPVDPQTPFRLASLTKPLTAAVVLALVDRGRLGLDQPAAPILRGVFVSPTQPASGHLSEVTVRHLLAHSAHWGPQDGAGGGGMDGGDLARFQARQIGDREDFRTLLRAAWELPPTEPPGSSYAYSTFGSCALGALVEASEGRRLDDVWSELLFTPAGVRGFGVVGEAIPGEASYYDHADAPRLPGQLGRPDDYWRPRREGSCIAGGRLVASAPDYLRVMLAIGGRRKPAILSDQSRQLFFDASATLDAGGGDRRTLGLLYWPRNGGVWWHTGGTPGTTTWYARSGAFDMVALFNGQPHDRAVYREIAQAMWRAVRSVERWPEHDLFR
jgi:CubicO group peptidase (beta-lactamase class C family)